MDARGLDGTILSELVYGAYIGLDDLQSKNRANSTKALAALRQMILTIPLGQPHWKAHRMSESTQVDGNGKALHRERQRSAFLGSVPAGGEILR
jgi:hypothetical protein